MVMTYEEGYKKIWSVFNALRGAFDLYEYCTLVMYLITLHNNKGFRESLGDVNEPLTPGKLSGAVCGAVQYDETGRSRILLDILDILSPELSTTNTLKAASGHDFFGLLSYRPTLLTDAYSILCSIEDAWYEEYYPRLFDDILFNMADAAGKSGGEFIQPAEVTKLVSSLSGYEGHGSIYNPYAGAASYAVEMQPQEGFFGQEINGIAWAIAVMRMMAHGLDASSVKRSDSLINWQGVNSLKNEGQQFDFIVSTPPFSMMINPSLRENVDPFRSFRRVDEDFLYRGALSLNPNGALTGVFSTGVTFRETPAEKELRRELIEQGLVSKVILLPSNLFYGCGIPSVIIQLKNAESDGTITFMDGSNFFKKVKRRNILCVDELLTVLKDGDPRYVRSVTIDEVKANGYSLVPQKYFLDEEAVPEGYVSYRVSDVISSLKPKPVSPDEIKGHILNPADLSKTPFASAIKPFTLNYGELKDGFSRVSEPFIAVAKVGSLRPTMVDASEESPVFFGNSIAAFKLAADSIYAPLFLYEWRRKSDALPELGAVIRRTSIKDALDIVLHLPGSHEEQESLYARLANQDKLAKARELGLEEVIASQKRDYITMLRSRKHDLDNCLGAAKNDFSALSKSLKRMKMENSDLVNSPLADGLEITVGEQLEKIRHLLDKMSVQIKHFTDESVFGDAEKVDLIAKLNSIQAHGTYIVKHETDLASMPHNGGSILRPNAFVKFNSFDLDRVIDNIVRNAEKHGFKDPDLEYTLKISLSYDYSDKMYVVEFQNNGMPMPKGMDTLRYGIDGERGKDSDGQGKGGWIVKSIVEHFGGKIEVYNDPEALFPVGILIKLPKYED